MDTSIFKAYDIRGVYPEQINEDIVYAIAQGYTAFVQPKNVVVGKDVRESSPALHEAAVRGFTDAGVDVIDIGTVSTDMMYFAVAHLKADGGITISASHNPREYNGIKMVRKDAIPISGASGIEDIKDMVVAGKKIASSTKGTVTPEDIVEAYIDHCLTFIDPANVKPLHVVANANFGMAGVVIDRLIEKAKLPITLERLNFTPDGTFPKGRPDPLIPENRGETIQYIKDTKAQFAVAWDADADRCFFFDEHGDFIEGCFIVALLASIMLRGTEGERVVIDPRNIYASTKAITDNKGVVALNRSGHTFIKERMRKENAIFGGENSAHLYFRDNFYADNGIIPFLLIVEELSRTGKALSELVAPWIQTAHVSGEINFTVKDTEAILEALRKKYSDARIDETDGLSFEYDTYRFNVRASNTEPLLRLNVEGYDAGTVEKFKEELSSFIENF